MSGSEYQCGKCFVGRYQEAEMPYICWVANEQVMVPDVPGFQCDVCGDSFHDPDYILHLHLLINRSAKPSRKNKAGQRQVSTGGKESGPAIGRSAKS